MKLSTLVAYIWHEFLMSGLVIRVWFTWVKGAHLTLDIYILIEPNEWFSTVHIRLRIQENVLFFFNNTLQLLKESN